MAGIDGPKDMPDKWQWKCPKCKKKIKGATKADVELAAKMHKLLVH